MLGNVVEWVADWYGDKYYSSSPATDPAGPTTGEYRVLRGGSYGDGVWSASGRNYAQSVFRGPWIGFRCVGE